MELRKDRSLDTLARSGNVAQFVSFMPAAAGKLKQQYSRVTGFEPNYEFADLEEALGALLSRSSDLSVNIRSYAPDSPRSHEFVYGLRSLDEAVAAAHRLAAQGLFIIANETIDINDGGVSGVVQGDIVEFAPDDTPRCVEKPGVASLPKAWAIAMLKIVYGFSPDIDTGSESRLEFSIHPRPRGWKQSHTLAWELERLSEASPKPTLTWPNRFSRHIGDKAYGLLMAHVAGLSVPRTTVIGRRVAPFSFGKPTGSCEVWTRTCPHEPEPGLYTTRKGWTDPFRLMAEEDPRHEAIASVISQDAVPATYSGAAIVTIGGALHIEGRAGEGDGLMLGHDHPEQLPLQIHQDVTNVFTELSRMLGAVRFEWVHDGKQVWIVQLHRGATVTSGTVLVPGEASRWYRFEAANGLEALRAFLRDVPEDGGVSIEGEIGLTSHLADLIRKARKPARIAVPA
ncbi:hypothetical protein [Mesorhizobium sp. WSM2239]|uniref:Uncharacterized protein n=2 Tax=unclassified Mesorhizobium TaxID=325217 RepID=A0AAU8D5Q1_9HYPH